MPTLHRVQWQVPERPDTLYEVVNGYVGRHFDLDGNEVEVPPLFAYMNVEEVEAPAWYVPPEGG